MSLDSQVQISTYQIAIMGKWNSTINGLREWDCTANYDLIFLQWNLQDKIIHWNTLNSVHTFLKKLVSCFLLFCGLLWVDLGQPFTLRLDFLDLKHWIKWSIGLIAHVVTTKFEFKYFCEQHYVENSVEPRDTNHIGTGVNCLV